MSELTPSPPRRRPWPWLAAGALLILYAWWSAQGLNPTSLWLDDLWVALLAQHATPAELVRLGSSSPPGFTLQVKLAQALVRDPELGAQLPAYLAGLLALAQVMRVAHRCGGWPAALGAGVILACNPLAIAYAARAKQFTGDMLISALHLEALLRLGAPNAQVKRWQLPAWSVAAALGFWVSTVSVFVAWACAPFLLVRAWTRDQRVPAGVALGILGLGTAAICALFLYPGVNQQLTESWAPNYLPLDLSAPIAPLRVLHDWLRYAGHADSGPLRSWGVVLAWGLLCAGGLWCWKHPPLRPLLGAWALLLAGLVVLNLARRFPLRTGRVELFVAPWVALGCGLGVRALWARGLTDARWRALGVGLGLGSLIQLFPWHPDPYPRFYAQPLAAALAAELRPDDAVWVNLHGSFALSYYGAWPVALVDDPRLGTQFHPEPELDRLLILDDAHNQLDPQPDLSARPPRVWVFAVHQATHFLGTCDATLRAKHYVPLNARQEGSCWLVCYVRR